MCWTFFPSRSYRALFWEIYTEIDIQQLSKEIAVSHCVNYVFMMAFGIDVLTWQVLTMRSGMRRLKNGNLWKVVRDLSYVAPSREAVCDTAVVDTGRRRV